MEITDRLRSFTNFNGVKQLVSTHYISHVYVRIYDIDDKWYKLADDKQKKYNKVNTYNDISYGEFAKKSAETFNMNVNNISLYQPYPYDSEEKVIRNYLIYA